MEVIRIVIKNGIQVFPLHATDASDSGAFRYVSKGRCKSLSDDTVPKSSFVKGERSGAAEAILDLTLEQQQLSMQAFIQGFYKIGHRRYNHCEVESKASLANGDHMICCNMTIAGPNIGRTEPLSNGVE